MVETGKSFISLTEGKRKMKIALLSWFASMLVLTLLSVIPAVPDYERFEGIGEIGETSTVLQDITRPVLSGAQFLSAFIWALTLPLGAMGFNVATHFAKRGPTPGPGG